MKQHILVVDDDAQIRDLLALQFARRGYQVSTAATPDETLRLIREFPIHLVVLDIGLAEADGLNLLAQLKKAHPFVRVVMLTGMGLVDDLLREAHQKGADGYVSKTNPFEDLLETVRRVLKPVEHS